MRSRTALFCLLIAVATNNAQTLAEDQQGPVRITPQVSRVDASFRGLAVRNEREAWVTGSQGTVIRTSDAGRTWRRIVVPDSDQLDFRDVEVLPAGTVVLMGAGSGRMSRVLRSTDSGATWRTVLVNGKPEGFFDGLAFADGKRGVLFGDPVGGRLDIHLTDDGGATWRQLPPKQRPALKKGEYGFAASGTSVAIDDRNIWVATGGSVARVLHSPDAGATWTAYETPVRSGNESSGIFSIAFVTANAAVVIGGDYAQPKEDRDNVAWSVDGGKTWMAVPSVRMPHKACVRSLGQGRLLTCGRTGVAFSKDGGRSWVSVTTAGYFTLAVDGRTGTGFLAGSDGRVARFELNGAQRD